MAPQSGPFFTLSFPFLCQIKWEGKPAFVVECVEGIAVESIAILAWRRIVISIEVISIELAHEWYRRFLNLHQSITAVSELC